MRKIPLFSPSAEAMMAALASRAYEWSYWEIDESFEVASDGRLVNLVTILRSKITAGTLREISLSPNEASPFLAVDRLLKASPETHSTKLIADFKTWHDSPNPMATFFRDESYNDLTDPSFITDVLSQQNLSWSRTPLRIKRVKNSLGFAQDSVE